VGAQQVGEVDLVGALEDRVGVVDDDQPLGFGLLGEAVGVVVDRRGGTDEQGVELSDADEILARDQLDVEAEGAAGADEALDRAVVAGRQLLLRVDQDRQVVAVAPARPRTGPPRRCRVRAGSRR
jgi:hypothetical protein